MSCSIDATAILLLLLLLQLADWITRGRSAIFGHIVRLPDSTLAHQALLCQVEFSVGRPPDQTWKHQPGHLHAKWTDQLHSDNNTVPIVTLWRQAVGQNHSRAMLRSKLTSH